MASTEANQETLPVAAETGNVSDVAAVVNEAGFPNEAAAADSATDKEVHFASSDRTKTALLEFKRKMGLCEVEGCEHKEISERDGVQVCENHSKNGLDAPVEPLRRGRKRKSEDEKPPAVNNGIDTRISSRMTCMVEGCEKLRAKAGYCTRHFKDKDAPIRSGPADYERRYCTVEGCERLRSKGNYCHRHNQDIDAPIRNKGDHRASITTEAKKECSIEKCDRLVVKGGYCSRHFKNPNAPVKETPAFSFDGVARWDELFPQLETFVKENGHARYPTTRKTDLAKFVMHIRGVYRSKRNKAIQANPSADPSTVEPDLSNSPLLTPERMAALKQIGFEFQLWSVDAGQWETRFQELLEYKLQKGNFNVPVRENATLSSWCKTQRQRYKNTMAIYQGLNGAEFHGTQVKASGLYQKAKTMAADAKQLGMLLDPWKVTEAKDLIDPEKICKLTAVGFEWDLQQSSFTESWESKFGELMRYKIINGNCRVPKTGEHAQLGQWVKQMRKYYSWKQDGKNYPKTFTDERIQRLNELGFEWRLKDANIDHSDKAEPVMDVARRPQRDGMETALHRQANEKPMTMEEMNRYEPFRAANVMYEQRGWL
ncbi:MAG: hypothetical protein SGILL_003251 [Bacillariaceae sp.]